MKLSLVLGAATIASSLVFIIFLLNAFIAPSVMCETGEKLKCEFEGFGIPFFVGVGFITGFIIIDAIIIYIIIKGWLYITRLKIRYNEIEKLKEIAEKNYYKKKIDEQTFKNLIQSYDKELIEIELKIKEFR